MDSEFYHMTAVYFLPSTQPFPRGYAQHQSNTLAMHIIESAAMLQNLIWNFG